MKNAVLRFAIAVTILFTALLNPPPTSAQVPGNLQTAWWPDPATGLMWTGQVHADMQFTWKWLAGTYYKFTYQDAANYCSSLKIGGYTGWRLPTFDEVKAMTQPMRGFLSNSRLPSNVLLPIPPDLPVDDAVKNGHKLKSYLANYPKGVSLWRPPTTTVEGTMVWTSSPSAAGSFPDPGGWNQLFVFEFASDRAVFGQKSKPAAMALCTRTMEPELAEVAGEASPAVPVPDVTTLKKYIPLNKARLAYNAGNFQESIEDAQQALHQMPNLYRAWWAMGIASGRLGQWDRAVDDLKKANKLIEGEDLIVLASLHWAEDNKKAAAKGHTAPEQTPEWYTYPTTF